jgi:hypothetical protein
MWENRTYNTGLSEPDLYNLHTSINASRVADTHLRDLIIILEVKHLRYEHNMTMKDIAARIGIKMKEVKEILT